MKTKIILTVILLAFGISLFSQTTGNNPSSRGDITAAGANCFTTNACIVLFMSSTYTSISVNTSGTFSMTLKPEQTNDGINWSSAGADITTATLNTYTVAAMTGFRIRASAVVSGTVTVNIVAGGAISVGGGVGSTPGGATTNVQYNLAGAFAGDSGLTYVGGANPALAVGAGSGSPTFTINGNGAPSTAGNVRLSSNITIGWRNVGNTANLILAHDQTTDFLTYSGTPASAGFQTGAYATLTNCSVNSVSPAACASAAAGSFVVPTTTTAYTVNTTRVTAASRIFLFPHTDTRDLPGAPTCVVPAITSEPVVTAIVAATSFTFGLASTAGQTCWDYWIVN